MEPNGKNIKPINKNIQVIFFARIDISIDAKTQHSAKFEYISTAFKTYTENSCILIEYMRIYICRFTLRLSFDVQTNVRSFLMIPRF